MKKQDRLIFMRVEAFRLVYGYSLPHIRKWIPDYSLLQGSSLRGVNDTHITGLANDLDISFTAFLRQEDFNKELDKTIDKMLAIKKETAYNAVRMKRNRHNFIQYMYIADLLRILTNADDDKIAEFVVKPFFFNYVVTWDIADKLAECFGTTRLALFDLQLAKRYLHTYFSVKTQNILNGTDEGIVRVVKKKTTIEKKDVSHLSKEERKKLHRQNIISSRAEVRKKHTQMHPKNRCTGLKLLWLRHLHSAYKKSIYKATNIVLQLQYKYEMNIQPIQIAHLYALTNFYKIRFILMLDECNNSFIVEYISRLELYLKLRYQNYKILFQENNYWVIPIIVRSDLLRLLNEYIINLQYLQEVGEVIDNIVSNAQRAAISRVKQQTNINKISNIFQVSEHILCDIDDQAFIQYIQDKFMERCNQLCEDVKN